MKKKALLINEGFSSNLGDQAIKASMSQLLSDNNYSIDFAFYSQPSVRQLPSNYYNDLELDKRKISRFKKRGLIIRFLALCKNFTDYFLWVKKNKRIIENIVNAENYDVIIIGGGQLINTTNKVVPSYFSAAMKYWVKFALDKIDYKPKIYVIAVGAASNFNKLEISNYKYALGKVDGIWVRDNFSQDVLTDKFNVKANLIPDIAYYGSIKSMKKSSTVGAKICLFGIYSYREFSIKFDKKNLSQSEYYETWTKKMLGFLKEGYAVNLFYTTETDAHETLNFQEYVLSNYNLKLIIRHVNNLKGLQDLYQEADKVYSARMHALLLARKTGCLVEAYIISQKLKSFNEEYILNDIDVNIYNNSISEQLGEILSR